jgi:hypothetical protein
MRRPDPLAEREGDSVSPALSSWTSRERLRARRRCTAASPARAAGAVRPAVSRTRSSQQRRAHRKRTSPPTSTMSVNWTNLATPVRPVSRAAAPCGCGSRSRGRRPNLRPGGRFVDRAARGRRGDGEKAVAGDLPRGRAATTRSRGLRNSSPARPDGSPGTKVRLRLVWNVAGPPRTPHAVCHQWGRTRRM